MLIFVSTFTKGGEMLVATCGMLVVDHIATKLPHEPRSGLTQYTDLTIQTHVGGHPINVAINLVKLGAKPEFIATVGAIGQNDYEGFVIQNALKKYGLCDFLQQAGKETGQDLILVPDGKDRSFNISPGANMDLSAYYVKDTLQRVQPKVLSIRPGYSGIDGDLEKILKPLKNTFVLLDIMKPYKRDWSYLVPVFKYVDAVHCNEQEALNITGQKTIKKACKFLENQGVKFIFITYGEDGAKLVTPEYEIEQKGFKVDAIDPTGCGDAFCAGAIYQLIKLHEFLTSMRLSQLHAGYVLCYAQAVGAACATGIGTTSGVSIEKVEKILREVYE